MSCKSDRLSLCSPLVDCWYLVKTGSITLQGFCLGALSSVPGHPGVSFLLICLFYVSPDELEAEPHRKFTLHWLKQWGKSFRDVCFNSNFWLWIYYCVHDICVGTWRLEANSVERGPLYLLWLVNSVVGVQRLRFLGLQLSVRFAWHACTPDPIPSTKHKG